MRYYKKPKRRLKWWVQYFLIGLSTVPFMVMVVIPHFVCMIKMIFR